MQSAVWLVISAISCVISAISCVTSVQWVMGNVVLGDVQPLVCGAGVHVVSEWPLVVSDRECLDRIRDTVHLSVVWIVSSN